MTPAHHAQIDAMIAAVIRKEGGYVDDPVDVGGATKYGVTIGTLSRVLGRPATKADVQRLTVEAAADIYRQRYFFGPGLDRLPIVLQAVALDTSVLFGQRRAVKFCQLSARNLGPDDPGPIDGFMGPATRRAAAACAAEHGVIYPKAVIQRRRDHHLARVRRKPSQRRFLRGWLNRCDELERELEVH